MIPLRTVAVAVVVLLLVAAGAAEAREPLLSQFLRGSGQWLHINLVGGRLVLKAGQLPPFERRFNSGGVKELFRFRYDNGQPALSYERTASDERLTLNLGGSGGSVRIRIEPREKSAIVAVEFQQSRKEHTSLIIGSGDRQQVFRAADLWRLLLAQPQQCQQHVFPLLAMLRPDLKLAEMVPSVEQHLLDGARENAASASAAGRRWSSNWPTIASPSARRPIGRCAPAAPPRSAISGSLTSSASTPSSSSASAASSSPSPASAKTIRPSKSPPRWPATRRSGCRC